jgi:hypothetical protein
MLVVFYKSKAEKLLTRHMDTYKAAGQLPALQPRKPSMVLEKL